MTTPSILSARQSADYADLLDLGVPESVVLELDAQIDREFERDDAPDIVHIRVLVKTPKSGGARDEATG